MTILHQLIDGIHEVMRNKGMDPPPIGADTMLDASLALDSLDYAELVVRLESTLGVDPFATGASFEIHTVADLVNIYETAKTRTSA